MEEFKKEITFLQKQFIEGEWALVEISKTARFKELSRVDRSQHELHFMITQMMEQSEKDDEKDEEEKVKMTVDSKVLYKLVRKSVNVLLLVDENFKEDDKAEFLQDSGALLQFGLWLLQEKLTPFFSVLMGT